MLTFLHWYIYICTWQFPNILTAFTTSLSLFLFFSLFYTIHLNATFWHNTMIPVQHSLTVVSSQIILSLLYWIPFTLLEAPDLALFTHFQNKFLFPSKLLCICSASFYLDNSLYLTVFATILFSRYALYATFLSLYLQHSFSHVLFFLIHSCFLVIMTPTILFLLPIKVTQVTLCSIFFSSCSKHFHTVFQFLWLGD